MYGFVFVCLCVPGVIVRVWNVEGVRTYVARCLFFGGTLSLTWDSNVCVSVCFVVFVVVFLIYASRGRTAKDDENERGCGEGS